MSVLHGSHISGELGVHKYAVHIHGEWCGQNEHLPVSNGDEESGGRRRRGGARERRKEKGLHTLVGLRTLM